MIIVSKVLLEILRNLTSNIKVIISKLYLELVKRKTRNRIRVTKVYVEILHTGGWRIYEE